MSKIDDIIMNDFISLKVNDSGDRIFGNGYLRNLVYFVFFRENSNIIWFENFGKVLFECSCFSFIIICKATVGFLN